ncbi:phosphate butyryltransferase [Tepidibacillus marianensis]|uniref:phosphate butyryltransferase n=1 Tax=Tepidibacillus marianensis TaxID=3131995 RepID=UPI0030CE403C
MLLDSFQEMLNQINKKQPPEVAVAVAEDEEVLLAIKEAINLGIARFHLIGNQEKIKMMLQKLSIPKNFIRITDETDSGKAALKSVQSVTEGKSQIVMKGLIPTATILKAVLDKEVGLRTSRILSHVAVFETEKYQKLFVLTDAAMNIAPTLEQKVQIVENAIQFMRSLGIARPKIALIAAVETVNSKMNATMDAALLSKMADRGQIKDAIIDGPLALDNAISIKAAQHKDITSPVAGDADILLVPTIEAGNILYKSLVYFAEAKVAAMIIGAKAPVVLTSRSDSHETKLLSIALAVLSVQK